MRGLAAAGASGSTSGRHPPIRVGRHSEGTEVTARREPVPGAGLQPGAPVSSCPGAALDLFSFFEGFCGVAPFLVHVYLHRCQRRDKIFNLILIIPSCLPKAQDGTSYQAN